ncbi:cysteine-rich secretory family protein [Algoriphagus boseongensis]|uniref:Cysteine-rich secretory family protein n=1 Tax=Algoriphagus boseongensis TaxID=1442587 RepID=A0A4R6TCF7_9BACT|nr:CAP domain-containing protein [Algoriphagus boseongensis]TDQ19144.1 cysteine-rich secretory family protein [Algoriphagus boseongensis]
MKLRLLSTLFLLPLLSYSQNWKESDYQKFNASSFLSLPALTQALDFNKLDYPLLQAAIFYLTNLEREKYQLKPFQFSPEVEKTASGHAQDMVNYNFYSHTSPIRFRRTLRDRLNCSGLNPKYIGENICSTFGLQYEEGKKVGKPAKPGEFYYLNASNPSKIPPHTYLSFAKSVVNLWMKSPGHRQNILNPAFTHLGCGAFVYFEKSFYGMPYFMAVQNFIAR